jgi:hypothetical protein
MASMPMRGCRKLVADPSDGAAHMTDVIMSAFNA